MDLEKEMKGYSDIFDVALKDYLLRNDVNNLFESARYLPLAGGKRIRPFLAKLSCEATGGSGEDVLSFGLALELIHGFSLVHDDIMDKSILRRNIPTVHIKYGEPFAILAGDLLFARALDVLDYYSDPQLYAQISRKFIQGVTDVCEGQYLDMSFEKRSSVTKDEYMEMITKKTAALFYVASECGSIISGAPSNIQRAMKTYGEAIGLAFQIRDDMLDMSSDQELLGKDIGNDIRNGKKTLITVHALQHASGSNRNILLSFFGNPKASDEDINKVHKVFQDVGSIQFAEEKAKQFSAIAGNALSILPDSYSKEALVSLAEFAVTRVK